MKIRHKTKWMALLIAGSCVGCSTTQGTQSPGFFASWTNPFASLTASKSQARSDEQDDVIRLDKKPKATADFFIAAGELAESRRDMQTAVAQFQHAVKLDPKNMSAMRHLAQLHERLQNYPEAEQVYASAIAIAPTDPTPLNDLAQCLARQQKYDESIEKLNKAIAMRPHQTIYRNNMAKVLVKAGRPREAFEHLAVVHSQAEAHYNLGYMLREQGELTAASQHFAMAAQIDPNLEAAQQVLEEMGGANTSQTVNKPANRPAAKEVAAPRYLRAQTAKSVIDSDEQANQVDTQTAPASPKGYYDGVEESEKKSPPPAEVLAKRSKLKTGRKSAAELKAKIEDSEPTLR